MNFFEWKVKSFYVFGYTMPKGDIHNLDIFTTMIKFLSCSHVLTHITQVSHI